ncbi:MAG: phosphotransferase [Patescibacteria group bacterium]|nr:phosphotransferase [Patescibacteria group bacterium]
MKNIPETPSEIAEKISEADFENALSAYWVTSDFASISHQRLYGGIRNAVFLVKSCRGDFVLTIYKLVPDAENNVKRNLRIYIFLKPQGFSVPEVVPTKDGNLFAAKQILGAERLVSLHKYIGGFKIFPYRKDDLVAMGKMLSNLHSCLRTFPDQGILRSVPEVVATENFAGNNTVLHMDFARGNVLFEDHGNISVVLDFEEAMWGPPILDISKSLAIILKDNKEDSFDYIKEKFFEGYRQGATKLKDRDKLEWLVKYFFKRVI